MITRGNVLIEREPATVVAAQIPIERMPRASTPTNPTALGAAAESEAT
ncbi:MAG: hypothetical protein ACI9N0_000887 [Ilumatobacter sp.]|jgi:hypothetical protein